GVTGAATSSVVGRDLRRGRLLVEEGVDATTFHVERGQEIGLEDAAPRQPDAQRIDGRIVHPDLEVEMRSGRQAGRSDIADDLPLADTYAGRDALGEAGLMGVHGLVS